ncbi:probable inactive heme oxygenase 2, chloroplastic [Malania oleifera]|uniref:probable inactive heme oxygenase 2, chloroplastic n=1 Tax=Malania oleifera TaxID=397392 RepID=UPI0025AE3412|nr:probable inactive heme oxygenase 2, chloroplastic [Malania oleifera]
MAALPPPQKLAAAAVFRCRGRGTFLSLTPAIKNATSQRIGNGTLILRCSDSTTQSSSWSSEESSLSTVGVAATTNAPAIIRKGNRVRYRKLCPGESKGITEEMRFVAMKLRDDKVKSTNDGSKLSSDGDADADGDGETWEPSMEGFLKYLVDSKVVFDTVERIVDESDHVAYAYFRKTGLERSLGLMKDLEFFRQWDIVVPQPSTPGVSYAKYLEELADKSAPYFLCHFYNIYFSHIAGGQVIAKQASEKFLEGRELEFYRWEGDAQELLKGVREKLNMLGEHWSRYQKKRCLKDTAKSFRFLGQIVCLIIL